MLRLLTDENFNGYIVRGLQRRRPALELVRVQDVGLGEADDPTILEWAAVHDYILLFRFIRIRVRSDADAADRTPRSLRYRRAAAAAELRLHPTPPYRDRAR